MVYGARLPPSDVLVGPASSTRCPAYSLDVPSEPAQLTWDVTQAEDRRHNLGHLFVRNAAAGARHWRRADAAGDPLPGETAGEFTEIYPQGNVAQTFDIERRVRVPPTSPRSA